MEARIQPTLQGKADFADLQDLRAPRALTVLVTSGGTKVPLDQVRVLTNTSQGTTGALIGKELLDRGDSLLYLHDKFAKKPYSRNVDFEKLTSEECGTLLEELNAEAALFYSTARGRYRAIPVRTFYEYQNELDRLLKSEKIDVAILAMAASDYGCRQADGKISSKQDRLLLALDPLPKLISTVKSASPKTMLIGFKQLEDLPPDALINRAYDQLLSNKQELCVANSGDPSQLDKMRNFIVTKERGIIPVAREELHGTLAKLVHQRYSEAHYKTSLSICEHLPLTAGELRSYLSDLHDFAEIGLFPHYRPGERAEFGFLAKRTAAGTLITGRGSSKSKAVDHDLAIVQGLEGETLTVLSQGRKASLNAPVAHAIFEAVPDAQYILHAHINLATGASTRRCTSPGTKEDTQSVLDLINAGQRIIHQPYHGALIVAGSIEEIYTALENSQMYRRRPELYDLAYHRFQQNTRFQEVCMQHIRPGSKVLDAAAGTGEVSKYLYDRGLTDITLLDASPEMLRVAKSKLPALGSERFIAQKMEAISSAPVFDACALRQAVNYIAPADLTATFERIQRALLPGGVFLFNTFSIPNGAPEARESRHENGGRLILSSEGNLQKGKQLWHGQRAEIFDLESGDFELVYDLNRFYVYGADEFQRALAAAGFSTVNSFRSGNSLDFVAVKAR